MKKALSVGQCAADHSRISQLLKSSFNVEIETADDHISAVNKIVNGSFDLILVNRILDKTGSQGIDIIREIKSNSPNNGPHMMLVSNFEAAQDDAIAVGAEPGFGKDALAATETIELLYQYLGDSTEA